MPRFHLVDTALIRFNEDTRKYHLRLTTNDGHGFEIGPYDTAYAAIQALPKAYYDWCTSGEE